MKFRHGIAAAGCVLFGALTVLSAGALLRQNFDRNREGKDLEDLRAKISAGSSRADPSGGTSAKDRRTPAAVYGALKKQNPDFAAWIRIDGTAVDYPVMQTPKDPYFYLKHDFRKRYSLYGVPFLDASCGFSSAGGNWIVYGHNMKDGSMFSTLLQYRDPSYLKSHPSVRFDTLKEFGVYRIAAVLKTSAVPGSPDFFPISSYAAWKDAGAFRDFQSRREKLDLYKTGRDIRREDRLLMLSTCEDSGNDGRLVLIAVKKTA
ncbi:MAG: class B sortase [Oscillospiraceae bacterium]|jgi:sortase B|nr:class B sortase [Oscillospiraceae bacterium]MCI1990365.1 class B sortase [Oscillospiraceae bacterium]MCI2034699.1 class B sortase [Oscillospiraceae bacterium]